MNIHKNKKMQINKRLEAYDCSFIFLFYFVKGKYGIIVVFVGLENSLKTYSVTIPKACL